LVVLVGVDGDLTQEVAVIIENADVLVNDVETHPFAAVMVTNTHMENAASVTKGDLVPWVNHVFS
jgi:hypothetical protein